VVSSPLRTVGGIRQVRKREAMTASGTAGRAGTPEDTGDPRRGGTPDGGTRPGSGQPWPLVLPLALLIILGMAGLRGSVTQPRWNGPLHHDGTAIGLALEVVLGVLLVMTLRRRAASLRTPPGNAGAGNAGAGNAVAGNAVAGKLRGVLIFVLSGGMIAVAVAVIVGLHLGLFPSAPALPPNPVKPRPLPTRKLPPSLPHLAASHFPVAAVLYSLLIVALLAAVWLSVWWSRRFRRPGLSRADGLIAEDSEDLREAVESGRSALRTIDDARAAIIACYVAMESRLAERGAARAAADTPDELLARATRSGVVRGTAAARLTALFYEARFSSHPLDRGQRDAAEHALGELAAALTRAERAEAGA
jgi:hypothetical protein